jgi:adenylate cyclase, class 2
MSSAEEVEIKFRVADLAEVERKLRALGFRQVTPRTHEMNTLYDLPSQPLRARGELLRVRKYGEKWKLTHKSKSAGGGPHKSRAETETAVEDGEKLAHILKALGFAPTFRYEKFRSEFSDDTGSVVLDETPIGDLGEIEGPPDWIDQIAAQLGVARSDYMTDTYASLFYDWKRRTGSPADEMTFAAVGAKK